jgi:hypothetical protein
MAENIIALVPGASELSRYNFNEITVITKPECPDKEDYTYDDEDDVPYVEDDEFASAMNDYYKELEIYNLKVESGQYKIALLLDNKAFEPVYFSLEKPTQYSIGNSGVTAKEVQAAIKNNTATPELLEGEINRIRQREERSQELDSEKVQLTIHKQLSEFTSEVSNNTNLTEADMIGARLIIYQSLDYNARNIVQPVLFPETEGTHQNTNEEAYEILKNMTDQQFSYLIRMALCSKSESKSPRFETGYFLCQVAKEAGIPVELIEEEQKQKAIDRKERQELKIKELERKIKKLKPVA